MLPFAHLKDISAMKKFFYLLLVSAFFSCNNQEKAAREVLQKAQDLYDRQAYLSARQTLDSLKINFPKVFPVLKERQLLIEKIEYATQTRNLLYCDSMLLVKQAEAELLKKGFVFEKDPEYDDIGKYLCESQSIEKNLQRTYIRSSVNELGEMTLSSIYCGSRPVQHVALRVSIVAGEFAQTETVAPDGANNYSFSDGGMTTETVSYAKGRDNGVTAFIYGRHRENIRASLLGDREIAFAISLADKDALVKTCDLATVLSEIKKLST
jgi:hypothetical protein